MALLEVRDVTIRFGGIEANAEVNIDVERGHIVGLIGPNGAGKTTLFNAISGFVTPAAGGVRLDGEEILPLLPYERVTRGLSRTFQNVRLFPSLSVLDNLIVAFHTRMRGGVFAGALRLPRSRSSERQARRRADEVMEIIDLTRYRNRPASDLSYGTLRMTELACVMMLSPSLVLLDEPASGIAQRETEALGPLLRRVRDSLGATILMIEHDMPLIMSVSDVVYCLDLGRVIAQGSPAEVQQHPGVVGAYLGPRIAQQLAKAAPHRPSRARKARKAAKPRA